MTDIHVSERQALSDSKLRDEERAEHMRKREQIRHSQQAQFAGAEADGEGCFGAEGERSGMRGSSRHVEGYEAVLLRSDIKTRLRAFKESVGAHEKNLERCLVTAAIEIMLETPRLKEAWLERMARAVSTDTRLLLKTRQRQNKNEPFEGGDRS